jgi:perosamine synthetase
MERVEEFVKRKIRIGELYKSYFAGHAEVHTPAVIPGTVNSYWLFSMLLDSGLSISRDEMMDKLLLNGVETRPLFYPLHEMPPYRSFSQDQAFPVSSDISSRGLSLPSAVTLADREIRGIGEKIISLLEVKSMLGNS